MADVCWICYKGKNLEIKCGACKRAYHKKCYKYSFCYETCHECTTNDNDNNYDNG